MRTAGSTGISIAGGPCVRPFRRIFNGGWKTGGRWYGPPWQNLPKRVRAQLLIDGEAVAELDFRTCHPRLLCALAGMDLPFHDAGFDYYDLPGFDRSHVKRAFNVLINAAIRARGHHGARAGTAGRG